MAAGHLASARHLILAGAPPPGVVLRLSGQPSELWPAGCDLQVLAGPGHDVTGALEALAETVGPPRLITRGGVAWPAGAPDGTCPAGGSADLGDTGGRHCQRDARRLRDRR
jgi:acetolactate synthase I/II/III large subunit